MQLAPGAVVADRYELTRLLGEGGMGAVWAASHRITKKQVALKFLKAASGSSDKAFRRFLREARAVSAVDHPNVVQVHDVFQAADGTPVMVLDLLQGEDLAAKLARERRLDLVELARLMLPVISAVGTAHAAGIVHRDLKPDNVFLHRRPDGRVEPRVLDFGIAKLGASEGSAAETAHLTQTGAVMGTPYYMPPEQVYGEKDVDPRADVWAVGVMLYECLSGQRPFRGENFGQLFKAITLGTFHPLDEVAPWVPRDVVDLVHRMLVPERTRRSYDLRDAYEVLAQHSEAAAPSFGEAQFVDSYGSLKSKASDLLAAAAAEPTRDPESAAGSRERALRMASDRGAGGTALLEPEAVESAAARRTELGELTSRTPEPAGSSSTSPSESEPALPASSESGRALPSPSASERALRAEDLALQSPEDLSIDGLAKSSVAHPRRPERARRGPRLAALALGATGVAAAIGLLATRGDPAPETPLAPAAVSPGATSPASGFAPPLVASAPRVEPAAEPSAASSAAAASAESAPPGPAPAWRSSPAARPAPAQPGTAQPGAPGAPPPAPPAPPALPAPARPGEPGRTQGGVVTDVPF